MTEYTLGFETYASGIRQVFAAHSDETAIRCLMKDGSIRKMSFGVLLRYIEDFHDLKESLGLADGDRVLVLSDKTADALVTFLVLSANHLTVVMADAALPDAELLPLVDHCRVRAVFADLKQAEKMLQSQPAPVFLTYGPGSCGRRLSDPCRLPDAGIPTPDSVAILFSSGTTARRKSVEISYASILLTHRKIKDKGVMHPRFPGQPMLEVFPMSHVSGLFSAFTVLFEGISIAALETLSSDALGKAFKVFRPLAFGMVPKVNDLFIARLEEGLRQKHLFGLYAFLSRLADSSVRRTGRLDGSRRLMMPFRSLLYGRHFSCLFSGGAPGTPHTAEVIRNLGIAYLDLYASTECGVYIASTQPGDTRAPGSVGNVLHDPYTQTVIHAPGPDGTGEIYVKTDQIMNGYFGDPELTAEAFDGEFFKTGDLGRIDEEGYLYLTGRLKESILMPNGAKVAPVDLERLLAPAVPDGVRYAVVGVPSPEDGADRIHLFLERDGIPDEEQLRESILQFQYREMNQYRIDGIHFLDSIPVTNIGKPRRYLLKEYALTGAGFPDRGEAAISGGGKNPQEAPALAPDRPGSAADAAEVERTVFKIVRETAKTDRELTGLEDFRKDLGMDSLSLMEMCTEIESRFAVSVGAFLSVIPNAREMTDYILDPIFEGMAASGKNPTKKVNAYLYPAKRNRLHILLFNYFRNWSLRNLDFRVEGIENVRKGRQYIFCPNHQTHFDGLFVWTALGDRCPPVQRLGCMSKAEHLDHGVTALMMRTLGGIPVERSGNTIDSTRRSITFIQEGNSFLIHPEGTRTRDGRLGPFRNGAARIAIESGITIIPVAISGGYEIWPYNRTLPDTKDQAGRKRILTVRFCPEVKILGREAEDITREIREKIVAALRAESGSPTPY